MYVCVSLYILCEDLAIVLGSSMTVGPFCELPTLAKKMVLVNLQETPYDGAAVTTIHASCDEVMKSVATEFGISQAPLEVIIETRNYHMIGMYFTVKYCIIVPYHVSV